jgi:hypothetical protein
MHLFNKLVLVFLLAGCASGSKVPKSYDYTPALLHASSALQTESIGFNIVNEIQTLVYPRLLTGDLPLWENSEKKIQISKERFAQLEITANRPFVTSNDLFIHEAWQIFKRNFDFGILGFSFTGVSKNGAKINFGYIDAADVIDLMRAQQIPNNANGNSSLSYWNALLSNTFQSNLVQFGKNDFRANPQLAFDLKYQAMEDPKVFRNFYQIIEEKEIEYRILSPAINSSSENELIYKVLERAINDNKQILLNATEDSYFTYLTTKNWKIESISVFETWTKKNNIPFQQLKGAEFFIDGHTVYLKAKNLEELNIKINLQGLEEYLTEKRFNFLLQQINTQEIAPREAEAYYNALRNNPWNKIQL